MGCTLQDPPAGFPSGVGFGLPGAFVKVVGDGGRWGWGVTGEREGGDGGGAGGALRALLCE